jgi:hypothetical protein
MKKTAKDISLDEIDKYFEQHKEEILAEQIAETAEDLKKRFLERAGVSAKIVRKPDQKRLAADIAHQIDVLATQLRGHGVPNPITQARNKLACELRFASGNSLHRWLRRNR